VWVRVPPAPPRFGLTRCNESDCCVTIRGWMATYWAESGFMAAKKTPPDRNAPLDWYVWHFTHIKNLPSIVRGSGLSPDARAPTAVSVTDQSIKGRRSVIPVVPLDTQSVSPQFCC
jgi:hypothetical protein